MDIMLTYNQHFTVPLLFQTETRGKANLRIKFVSLGIIGYIFGELSLLAEGPGQFPTKSPVLTSTPSPCFLTPLLRAKSYQTYM